MFLDEKQLNNELKHVECLVSGQEGIVVQQDESTFREHNNIMQPY